MMAADDDAGVSSAAGTMPAMSAGAEADRAAARDVADATADGRREWRRIQAAVGEAVVGAQDAVRLMGVALLADGHVLVEDVPGIGKTLLARAFARALGLASARVQGTPDLLPVDVTGSSLLDGGTLRFVPGPVFTNVLLVDEINRATPRTQSALLEAMQERQVSVEGVTRPLPDPFLLLATQNPVEFEGTFALPQAQLDRFLVRIRIGYPDEAEERRIARRHQADAEPLERVPTVLDGVAVRSLREEVRRVRVADEVEAYVTAIVRATREHPDVSLGGSPRATVALYRAAQAHAAVDGRDFVRPDDVKAVAEPVLGHRLLLDLDRSIRGVTSAEVVSAVLAAVPAPPTAD
jgi:MoxR-like ATPase